MNKKYPKGIDLIAKRVIKAAKKFERIVIFGDADLDGIASVVILQELFEFLNPLYVKDNLSVYFPNREVEGYGLSDTALDVMQEKLPAILFVLDAGISNFKEIDRAKKMGFEVIVIDHHKILGKLPKADLIVDPKQKDDNYPFKELAAAGLVYKLAEKTLKNAPDFLYNRLLELAALATLADLMPIEEDNEEIVNKGLEALLETQRSGLLALIQLNDLDVNSDLDITQGIIAPLNSFRLKNHIAESYSLLTESSLEKSRTIAKKLIKQTIEKKRAIQMFVTELKQEYENKDKTVIFSYSKAWPSPYLGIIASKMLKIYKRPVFVCKQAEESICSARLPKPMDGVIAMEACKKHLITYGGHPPACGCRVKEENLDKFGKCLKKYFKDHE